ncbi:acyltransferase family protein [Ancylobacter sp. G4_0304]|uniref:acyltransferase family protein n=1 Tax=Ancylobacter sp. G4_0304 TaxID=3114289 RepID=UPI0039C6A92E
MTTARIQTLDGLRALAIGLVLIFHLNETYLPGGFIGVDVFFVISGYIITKTIMERRGENRFSLADFYMRRISRLMPSVIATVLASLAAASLIYSPGQVLEYAWVGLYSILSVANIYFFLHSGYFDSASQSNIFLHMWSLSVEEQFYLVWPFFLLLATGGRHARSWFIGATLLGIAAAWAIFALDAAAAFFLMPARVFQFSAGAIVATVHLQNPALDRGVHPLSNALFGLGAVIVLFSAILSNGQTYDFVVAALAPAAGTALLLTGINAPLSAVTLGQRAAAYVGRRAYTLYLVHWPIMVMSGLIIGQSKSFTQELAIVAICIVAAEILRQTVEKPLDFRRHRTARRFRLVGVGVLAIACAGLIAFASLRPVSPKLDGNYVEIARKGWADRIRLGRSGIGCSISVDDDASAYNRAECFREGVNDKLFIIGDSYAQEVYIMLSQFLPAEKMALAGGAGCFPIYPKPPFSSVKQSCIDLNTERFKWVKDADVSAIVVTSNWHWWTPKLLEETFAYLASTGKPVIVVGPRPRFFQPVPVMLDSANGSDLAPDLSSQLKQNMNEEYEKVTAAMRPYGDQFLYLDLRSILCPGGKCPAFLPDGHTVYLDESHITAPAAINAGQKLDATLGPRIRQFIAKAAQASSSPGEATEQ